MDVYCSVPGCNISMIAPGAVVISPPLPNGTEEMFVEKFHICVSCWTTRFMQMFEKEPTFQNDAAQWPNLRTAYAQDVAFFRVGDPPAVPLSVDEKLKVVAPTDMGLKALMRYKKQPLERDDIPKIDLPAEMAKLFGAQKWREAIAPITEAADKYAKSLVTAARQDNQLVENYSYTDAELLEIMSKQSWFHTYQKTRKYASRLGSNQERLVVMLHPCIDYRMGVIHAPHDWKLEGMTLECPGKFDEGGTSCGPLLLDPPDSGSGSDARELTPFEEHLELEQATSRVLVVA